MEPNDFKAANGGHLEEEFFPLGDIETRLAAWILEAEGKTDSEEAQKAWVYYKAFESIATRLAHSFSGHSIEGIGTEARAKDQRDRWAEKAAAQKLCFDVLTTPEEESVF